MPHEESEWQGYEWTALSVTTIGILLAAVQGSALLIALPEIMTYLQAGFMTIMSELLGFLLITTALVPVVGRLADMFGRKNLYNAGFATFTLGSFLCRLTQPHSKQHALLDDRPLHGAHGRRLGPLCLSQH